jgi:hypothetical protein
VSVAITNHPTTPSPTPERRKPALGKSLAKPAENPFRSSPARRTLDTLSIGSGALDAVDKVVDTTRTLEMVAESAPVLSGVASRVAAGVSRAASVGGQLAMEWPLLTKSGRHLSRWGPMLGLGVAVADVAKARMERNPRLKRVDEGQAVFSVVSGVAGFVAGMGSVYGLTALAPLVLPLTVLAIGTTVVNVVDGLFMKGAIARAIATGLRRMLNMPA